MTKVQLVRARSRSGWPRSARALAFVLVCLATAILGPTAAFAVSSSGTGGGGLPTTPKTSTTTPVSKAPKGNPFARRGMWIWVLSDTDAGNLKTIISQAKSYGVGTLYIKSGDGADNWPQFNSTLTSDLHRSGLKVCAWQYVYGNHPALEAQVADDAVKEGADCLLIDAETEYQGKYVQAQTYMTDLRKKIGSKFPVGLAGFPYVGYHLSFPYSVFLGPGGAQYNTPQMYWTDIETSVENVYATTYSYNRIYGRPIYPLGELYPSGTKNHAPPASQIETFNKLARLYKAGGTSWYDWQSANKTGLAAISKIGTVPANFKTDNLLAEVTDGNQGDLVIWAQEHLDGWIHKSGSRYGIKSLLTIDGDFGKNTLAAVKAFQKAHAIPTSGVIGIHTWDQLLRVSPVKVTWVKKKSGQAATVTSAARSGRTVLDGNSLVQVVPGSAGLKAKRNELGGNIGQGRPRRP
jgi:peptidoglycan hydrolase-like protein with peptidoglycan-binding domain